MKYHVSYGDQDFRVTVTHMYEDIIYWRVTMTGISREHNAARKHCTWYLGPEEARNLRALIPHLGPETEVQVRMRTHSGPDQKIGVRMDHIDGDDFDLICSNENAEPPLSLVGPFDNVPCRETHVKYLLAALLFIEIHGG